jgi:hypothetical protein
MSDHIENQPEPFETSVCGRFKETALIGEGNSEVASGSYPQSLLLASSDCHMGFGLQTIRNCLVQPTK